MAKKPMILHSIGWALIESVTLILTSIVSILVMARLLGPTDFGIAVSATVTVQFLNLFAEGLFCEALVQRTRLDQTHINSAFGAALVVAIALVALCWFAGEPIARLYGHPGFAAVLRTASFGLPFAAYTGIQTGLLRRQFGFRQLAMRTLAARLAAVAFGLALAVYGAGPWSVVAQYLSAAVFGAVALWYWSSQPVGVRISPSALKELLRFVLPWLAGELLLVNQARLFQLVLGYFVGVRDFAFLNIAFRITDTVREVIGHIASNVGMSVFARVQHDRQMLAGSFAAGTRSLCIVAMPMFAGLAISAHVLVPAVLGDEWSPSVPIVQALAVSGLASFAGTFCYVVFSALGRPRLTFACGLFDVVASAAVVLPVASLGTSVIAAAWAARQFLSTVLALVVCARLLTSYNLRLIVSIGLPTLLAAGIALALWVEDTMLLAGLSNPGRLLLLMTTGGVLLASSVAATHWNVIRTTTPQLRGSRTSHDGFT